MANANPSSPQIINADKSQKVGKGKPRVREIKKAELTKEQLESMRDRPHQVIEENDKHTVTQLRSGTVKIVRH